MHQPGNSSVSAGQGGEGETRTKLAQTLKGRGVTWGGSSSRTLVLHSTPAGWLTKTLMKRPFDNPVRPCLKHTAGPSACRRQLLYQLPSLRSRR